MTYKAIEVVIPVKTEIHENRITKDNNIDIENESIFYCMVIC